MVAINPNSTQEPQRFIIQWLSVVEARDRVTEAFTTKELDKGGDLDLGIGVSFSENYTVTNSPASMTKTDTFGGFLNKIENSIIDFLTME